MTNFLTCDVDDCGEPAVAGVAKHYSARTYADFCFDHHRKFNRMNGIRKGLLLAKIRKQKRLRP